MTARAGRRAATQRRVSRGASRFQAAAHFARVGTDAPGWISVEPELVGPPRRSPGTTGRGCPAAAVPAPSTRAHRKPRHPKGRPTAKMIAATAEEVKRTDLQLPERVRTQGLTPGGQTLALCERPLPRKGRGVH